jgi:hypothetical protein
MFTIDIKPSSCTCVDPLTTLRIDLCFGRPEILFFANGRSTESALP